MVGLTLLPGFNKTTMTSEEPTEPQGSHILLLSTPTTYAMIPSSRRVEQKGPIRTQSARSPHAPALGQAADFRPG
ncbi:hypothetical protein VTN31DRAFT_1104 [Thermomyces dupontii]|uniref:uncharacterized protein n=1 Tax=Talaromyces thermophilus TaxID=28565 RepID=UPI003743F1ED